MTEIRTSPSGPEVTIDTDDTPATGDEPGYLSRTSWDDVGPIGWYWGGGQGTVSGSVGFGDVLDIDINQARTFSMWVATEGNHLPSATFNLALLEQSLFTKLAAGDTGYSVRLTATGLAQIHMRNTGSTATLLATTTTQFPTSRVDRLVHLMVVLTGAGTGASCEIYFDNVLQPQTASGTLSGTTLTTAALTHGVSLGTGTAASFFRGRMRDVALFGSALNASQRAQVYDNGVPGADLAPLAPLGWWKYDSLDGPGTSGIIDYGTGSNEGTATFGVNENETTGVVTLMTADDIPPGNTFEVVAWGSGASGAQGTVQVAAGATFAGSGGAGGGSRDVIWVGRAELISNLPIEIRIAPPSRAPVSASTATLTGIMGFAGKASSFGSMLLACGGGAGFGTGGVNSSSGSGGGVFGRGQDGFTSGVPGGAPYMNVGNFGVSKGGAGASSIASLDDTGLPAIGGGGGGGGGGQLPNTGTPTAGGIANPGGGGGGAGGGLNNGSGLSDSTRGSAGGFSGSPALVGEISAGLGQPNGGGGAGASIGTAALGVAGGAGADGDHWNSGAGGGGGSSAAAVPSVGGAGGNGGVPAGGGGSGGSGRGANGAQRGGLGGEGGKGRVTLTAYI